jgi:hypothetical protein
MKNFIKALQAGHEVVNPENWKNGQIIVNALASLLTIGFSFSPTLSSLGEEVPKNVAEGIFAVVGLVNVVATVVSSKKVGL